MKMEDKDPRTLSRELEKKLLDQLAYEWRSINWTYFSSVMKPPIFQLSDSVKRLGQWHGKYRNLEISRSLILNYPWPEVVEVLKHEVAHQYVDEILKEDEAPHGPAFQKVCAQIGISSSATGSPSQESNDAGSRIVSRIQKLLALAQSSNQNEAESAARLAHKLMIKFNIELDASREPDSSRRDYKYRHLGHGSGKIFAHERILANILTNYFFVEGIWLRVYRPLEGKSGFVFEICGLEHNLTMSEHVYDFLIKTSSRLWDDYKKSTSKTSKSDHLSFLAGVMRGFESKLGMQSSELQEQGLVWVPAADLKQYHKARHPKTSSIRRQGARKSDSFADGKEAGRGITLSKPIHSESNYSPKALRS